MYWDLSIMVRDVRKFKFYSKTVNILWMFFFFRSNVFVISIDTDFCMILDSIFVFELFVCFVLLDLNTANLCEK